MLKKIITLFTICLLSACTWWAEPSLQPVQGIAAPNQEMPALDQAVFYPSQDISYPQQTSQPIEIEEE